MKVVGITMMTNPDYRQDPARECIRQMLEICDEIVVVVGRLHDITEVLEPLKKEFPCRIKSGYIDWPQPEWNLIELPLHLNHALSIARYICEADWIIKFDTDYFIHENHRTELRKKLEQGLIDDSMLMSLEKVQFYRNGVCLMKGDIPICINAKHPIWYGYNNQIYTDLCQPILWDGKSNWQASDGRSIHSGDSIPVDRIKRSGSWLYNYGYTFKTEERAKELLYWFELAHAKFWHYGLFKTHPDEITQETPMQQFIAMIEGRLKRSTKNIPIEQHPKHIQQKLRDLTPDQFGHSLWGKIKL